LIGGEDDDYFFQSGSILPYIKTTHGYSSTSPQISHLLEIIQDLTTAERRDLVQFLTGSPRLPEGGWENLNPPLTVVMKAIQEGF